MPTVAAVPSHPLMKAVKAIKMIAVQITKTTVLIQMLMRRVMKIIQRRRKAKKMTRKMLVGKNEYNCLITQTRKLK